MKSACSEMEKTNCFPQNSSFPPSSLSQEEEGSIFFDASLDFLSNSLFDEIRDAIEV